MTEIVNDNAPHVRSNASKQKIMFAVLIALLPATIGGVYYFELNALLIIIMSMLTALFVDIVMQKITKQKFTLINASALVTGLLLALVLPPTVPLWIPIIGVTVAIVLGKYAFGTSNNIFNPALIGRAILVLSWPKLMTTWIGPDGVTSATPLAMAKALGTNQALSATSYMELFLGNVGGCIGETSAFLLMIGGLFLLFTKIIDWRIPLAYIGTVFLLASIFGQDVMFHILAGGLLIGAFFMATDYVTIPITKRGRWFFAIGCGLLTFVFRMFSSMPEGVMYSILIMNATYPAIERMTMPKPFGYKGDDDE